MNKRTVGTFYEEAACEFLKQQGLRIVCRNFRCKAGELDIIAEEGDMTVIVEVKYRSSDDFGGALQAVDFRKQKRICKCASIYRMLHREVTGIRYDVIGITKTRIRWVKNAFSHVGYDGFY